MDFLLSEEIAIGSLTCYEFFYHLLCFVLAWEIFKLCIKFISFGLDKLVDFIFNKFRKKTK